MKSMSKDTLTSKEFGALVGVTYQTLQRYDKAGLFSPAETSKGGWRRYTYEQIPEFYEFRRQQQGIDKNLTVGYIHAPISDITSGMKSRALLAYADLNDYLKEITPSHENHNYKIIVNDEPLHSFEGKGFVELFALIQSGTISRVVIAFDNQFTDTERAFIQRLCDTNSVTLEIMPNCRHFDTENKTTILNWKTKLQQAIESACDESIPESLLLTEQLLSVINSTISK